MARRLLAVGTLILVLHVALRAQDAAASKPLQGRWVVTSGEHGGKPMDAIKGGVMTVTGDAFEIRTSSGNMIKGTLRLNASVRPMQMDLVHADGSVWEAVYETGADTFRMNYVEKGGKDPRPVSFVTSDKTEESVVTLHRDATK
jgi:uncharacterized protein (TIGR03067 family)